MLRDTGQHRGIQFDLLSHLEVLMILAILSSNRPRICLKGIILLAQSGILEILMEEFGILSLGIRNPLRGIQNPGLS